MILSNRLWFFLCNVMEPFIHLNVFPMIIENLDMLTFLTIVFLTNFTHFSFRIVRIRYNPFPKTHWKLLLQKIGRNDLKSTRSTLSSKKLTSPLKAFRICTSSMPYENWNSRKKIVSISKFFSPEKYSTILVSKPVSSIYGFSKTICDLPFCKISDQSLKVYCF